MGCGGTNGLNPGATRRFGGSCCQMRTVYRPLLGITTPDLAGSVHDGVAGQQLPPPPERVLAGNAPHVQWRRALEEKEPKQDVSGIPDSMPWMVLNSARLSGIVGGKSTATQRIQP